MTTKDWARNLPGNSWTRISYSLADAKEYLNLGAPEGLQVIKPRELLEPLDAPGQLIQQRLKMKQHGRI